VPAHPVLEALPQAKAGDAPPQSQPADATRSPEDDFTEAPAAAEDEEEPSIGAPGPFAPPPVAEGADDLKYGGDSGGRYALYRLKKGEALYSAVVVRFTGRVDVQDVNDLAGQIARRSGIDDVTNIAIGYKVKIPLDSLLPEYLPRDDSRRQAWERKQAQVARYTNAARSRDLEGVAVILDAGHGGRDIGASHNGVWEHDYVYDILCRVKAVLEKHTRAKVLPTIRDAKEGWSIHDSESLVRNRAEVLLSDPPFHLNDSVSSVNMRWYLSNAWYRKLLGEGFDPLKVVFTSIHADARHPSLSGAMVYVPGEEYRRGRYGSAGEVYTRYREARQEPFVSFTRAERERSEGLSRQLAAMLIDSFNDREVGVQPFEPVRERIIRRGRAWVPAVLRCNTVPVETLIEVSNLSNPGDARALKDPAYRQRVAEAYVEGLMRYFAAPSTGTNGARVTGTHPQAPGK
jgi:N-acetylmuramoyl-L-alanine amidase